MALMTAVDVGMTSLAARLLGDSRYGVSILYRDLGYSVA